MSSKLPAIIVCERGGVWMPPLRMAVRGSGVRLVETRRPDEALKIASERIFALLAWELLPKNTKKTADALIAAENFRPGCSVILCNRPETLREADWRQLGAIHVVTSPSLRGETRRVGESILPAYGCDSLVRIAQKAFAGLPTTSGSLEERIRSQLPWAEMMA